MLPKGRAAQARGEMMKSSAGEWMEGGFTLVHLGALRVLSWVVQMGAVKMFFVLSCV